MRYVPVILAICAYFIVTSLFLGNICPSMIIIGLPCPACGLTRATFLLITGNFSESFNMHPLLVPILLFVTAIFTLKLFRPEKIKIMQVPSIILLFSTITLYIFRMINLFPYYPPMTINRNSMLHNTIELFQNLLSHI
ncbi:MAG: DUF2752 domain-containing protein [Defluviitaleaceae bacterium]|nr:DUF2752 domain-containing protein [Defluviitaleaceae bacterium]